MTNIIYNWLESYLLILILVFLMNHQYFFTCCDVFFSIACQYGFFYIHAYFNTSKAYIFLFYKCMQNETKFGFKTPICCKLGP